MGTNTTTVTTENKTNTRVIKPYVDIVEEGAGISLYANVPGASAETVDITLERNMLTLHAKSDVTNTLYQRAFRLSRRIDGDNITAAVKNGVLNLSLPFVAEVVPASRHITVNAA